jgi:hypothetical protein
MTAPTPVRAPAWSARPCTDADRAVVLDLFADRGFHFRTELPDLLSECEVQRLVADAWLLVADGEPVGLYALTPSGRGHTGNFRLHLRLRASAPLSWWTSAYAEIVRSARWHTDVVRIGMRVGEFDDRGLAAARAIGLTEEGTLPGVVLSGGRRWGSVCFSQVWAVRP